MLNDGFSMFSSQEIGSSLGSLEMIFDALQSEFFRFKFHSLSSNILKLPEFNLIIRQNLHFGHILRNFFPTELHLNMAELKLDNLKPHGKADSLLTKLIYAILCKFSNISKKTFLKLNFQNVIFLNKREFFILFLDFLSLFRFLIHFRSREDFLRLIWRLLRFNFEIFDLVFDSKSIHFKSMIPEFDLSWPSMTWTVKYKNKPFRSLLDGVYFGIFGIWLNTWWVMWLPLLATTWF